MTFKDQLVTLRACPDAVQWVGKRTAKQAWAECERANWLIWWLGKIGLPQTRLVKLACLCARTTLKYVPKGEDKPRKAIEAAEAWVKNPTKENRKAAGDAWVAARDAAHRKMCNLIRTEISWDEVMKVLRGRE